MEHLVDKSLMDGLLIDYATHKSDFNMPVKHTHHEYELYFIIEGSCYYFIDNYVHHLEKDDIVLINKHQLHKTSSTGEPFTRLLIEISEQPFQSIIDHITDFSLDNFFSTHKGIIQLNPSSLKEVQNKYNELLEELISKPMHYQGIALSKTLELFLLLNRHINISKSSNHHHKKLENLSHYTNFENPRKFQRINEIAAYLQKNCTANPSLDELSKEFFISKHYLSRLFKEATGLTINDYTNINRIRLAESILLNSDESISQIAQNLGFGNTSYFERVFKKYTDTTPLKYRKKYL